LNAILWDGHKQLHGYLEFGATELVYKLKDFSETSLNLVIEYSNIASVGNHKMFGIANEVIEIVSKDGKRNLFVVDDLVNVKKDLKHRLKLLY